MCGTLNVFCVIKLRCLDYSLRRDSQTNGFRGTKSERCVSGPLWSLILRADYGFPASWYSVLWLLLPLWQPSVVFLKWRLLSLCKLPRCLLNLEASLLHRSSSDALPKVPRTWTLSPWDSFPPRKGQLKLFTKQSVSPRNGLPSDFPISGYGTVVFLGLTHGVISNFPQLV